MINFRYIKLNKELYYSVFSKILVIIVTRLLLNGILKKIDMKYKINVVDLYRKIFCDSLNIRVLNKSRLCIRNFTSFDFPYDNFTFTAIFEFFWMNALWKNYRMRIFTKNFKWLEQIEISMKLKLHSKF